MTAELLGVTGATGVEELLECSTDELLETEVV